MGILAELHHRITFFDRWEHYNFTPALNNFSSGSGVYIPDENGKLRLVKDEDKNFEYLIKGGR